MRARRPRCLAWVKAEIDAISLRVFASIDLALPWSRPTRTGPSFPTRAIGRTSDRF